MSDDAWQIDRFGSGLTTTLIAMLAGARASADLALAVAECAAAAEAVCSERPMACGPGCYHCCVLNVTILLPEGLVIADWLREHLPDAALAAVRERLASHCSRIRWVDDEERIAKQVACPLLDAAGLCTIYPVRSLMCRAASSRDRSCCREAFRPVLIDGARRVPADLLRQSVYDVAFVALTEALHHQRFDDRGIELGAGILAFLERPECRERLLGGERLPRELWDG